MIEPEEFKDDRGFLKRSFSQKVCRTRIEPKRGRMQYLLQQKSLHDSRAFSDAAVRAGEAGPLYERRESTM